MDTINSQSTPVASVSDLQMELNDAMKSLASANEKIASLEKESKLKDAEADDLRNTIESLKADNANLDKVNDALNDKVEELTDELNMRKNPGELLAEAKKRERAVLPTDVFEVRGSKKKFISPVFKFKGERIVAAEAINNPELLERLVDAGCGSIVDVK
jgi:predicted nuclease with TOPRIM domain